MNIKWNTDLRRFEAELHDFKDEQPRLKAAGWRTDGPPQWVWYSVKSEPLTKLRTNRPAVLTISPEARAEYARLKEVADHNAATKALLAEHTKALKKKLKGDKQDAMKPDEYMDPLGFVCLIVKPGPPFVSQMTPPPPFPETTCFICGSPVYLYEYAENQKPCCMWCSKIVLDKQDEVC